MKKIICCVVFYGFFLNGLAMDGNQYIKSCKVFLETHLDTQDWPELFQSANCTAYTKATLDTASFNHQRIEGVKDEFASMFGRSPILFCLPDEVAPPQVIKVALKYMENHPEFLHVYAAFSILAALKEAFPCSPE